MKKPALAFLALLSAACVSAPLGPPDQVAEGIFTDIEAGELDSAARTFDRANSNDYRERLYPVLYGKAGELFAEGDSEGSAALLRFMHERYSESDAVAEALLYSLFLERAGEQTPSAELGKEIDKVFAAVNEQDSTPPVWTALVETQRAIDRGRHSEAREAYTRFLSAWDGQPAELDIYVDDLGRYLANPPAQSLAGRGE